jgi:hypothetical protein
MLRTWIDLQHRFYERVGQTAYCYSERANVCLLAAAAWRCDHIAIEEFATRKSNGWKGPGRIDLFVQIGECALCVEAKAIQLRAPQNEEQWRIFWQVVRAGVRAMRHEASRAARGTFRHRIGIVFCVISTRVTQSISTQLRELARDLDKQAARQTLDFLAVYMPADRLPAGVKQFPAVILAGSATPAAQSLFRGKLR